MKRTTKQFRRFYIDQTEDMLEYNEILNDPMCTITEKELMMEKTITSDGEGNTTTTITPTYLVHWEELKL